MDVLLCFCIETAVAGSTCHLSEFLTHTLCVLVFFDGAWTEAIMYLINIRGKMYCGVHGDFDGSAGKVQTLQTMARVPLYAVLSGHLHHNKIDEVQGVKTVMAGSFLGMDDYCVQKRIFGKAEQLVCVCDTNGIRCSYGVPL